MQQSPFLGIFVNGGADGSRTRDLLHAMQARYQLRYSPVNKLTHHHIAFLASLEDDAMSGFAVAAWAQHSFARILLKLRVKHNLPEASFLSCAP